MATLTRTHTKTLTNLDQLAVVDTETTGLDPDLHEIWEVALYLPDLADKPYREASHRWFLPIDEGRADLRALEIGHYFDRYPGRWTHLPDPITLNEFAQEFADLTAGRHLVGAVISFDEERLRRLLRRNGACPRWHYHLVDVEALAAGKLAVAPPWDSDELSRQLGVDMPSDKERHTALGDVMWAWRIYQAVMGS